jgi:hypothetical protein
MKTETGTTRTRRFVIGGLALAGILTAVALTVSNLPAPDSTSARSAPSPTASPSPSPASGLSPDPGPTVIPEPFVPGVPAPDGQRTTSEVPQGGAEQPALPADPPAAPIVVGGAPVGASELKALVKDFPTALALAPGSSVLSSSVTSSGATMQATLEATTPTAAADVVGFYTDLFAALQLPGSPTAAASGSSAVTFARGTNSVTLTVTPAAEGSRYSLFGVLAIGT